MSNEEKATCRGCGKELIGKPYYMGGGAYIPKTMEPCKVNFYGGYVCSEACDRNSSLELERSMPGHTASQSSLSTMAYEHLKKKLAMNNEPTIEQMNEALAYFMGYYYQASKFYPKSGERGKWFKEAKYHSSWDWLMPVISKLKECFKETFKIDPEVTNMHNSGINFQLSITNISSAHLAVYYAIEWYNKQQSND